MAEDMGTFRIDVGVENPTRPGQRRALHHVLVDTGAELSWFPRDALEETELPRVDGGQDSALKHRDLLRAFSALPEEQRAVLLLIAVEDLSYEEAARVLGVPIGTVMSRLSRGREKLRHRMHGDLDENSSRRSSALRRVR